MWRFGYLGEFYFMKDQIGNIDLGQKIGDDGVGFWFEPNSQWKLGDCVARDDDDDKGSAEKSQDVTR